MNRSATAIRALALGILMVACSEPTSSKRCVPVDSHAEPEPINFRYWCDWAFGHLPQPEGVTATPIHGWYRFEPESGRECDGCLWDGVEDEIAELWHDKWCPSQSIDAIEHVEVGCYLPLEYDGIDPDNPHCNLKFLIYTDTCQTDGGAKVIP